MKRTKLKTHTFALGKYRIDEAHIDGLCDIPGDERLGMTIMPGGSLKALQTAIHEASHAEGIPDRFLDADRDFSEHVGRFLWRLGWRRVGQQQRRH